MDQTNVAHLYFVYYTLNGSKIIYLTNYLLEVINHGVEVSLLERMERVGIEFFMMPVEEKKKYPMAPGTVQGYGQAFVFSEDQKLDWCNMFALGLEPPHSRNPKLWPTKPAAFRYLTLHTYVVCM